MYNDFYEPFVFQYYKQRIRFYFVTEIYCTGWKKLRYAARYQPFLLLVSWSFSEAISVD